MLSLRSPIPHSGVSLSFSIQITKLLSTPMIDQWTRFQNSVQRHLEFVPAETFDYSVNISLQHRYLFVETPKVCCSTIKLNLQRLETGFADVTWPHEMDVHNRDFSPLLKPSQVYDFDRLIATAKLFKFCFVRSPYTRLLSCYLDKIVGNKPPKRSILSTLGLQDRDLNVKISFAEFVEAICSQPISEMNPHWRPQYYQTLHNTLQFDFVGRFENFEDDFKHALALISAKAITSTATQASHKTGANQLLDHYYTDDILDQVNHLFEVDFSAFDYATVFG